MMAERPCDECGEDTQIKYLGKIRGRMLCKKCRVEVREAHRKETINLSSEDERKKIRELSRSQRADYNKAYYEKNKKLKRSESKEEPKIKGSKLTRKKLKSNSYLTIEDKRQLLRILMKKGLDFEEAKERLSNVIEEQKVVREKMREKNKSEEQIKIKQQEMLEELWNS